MGKIFDWLDRAPGEDVSAYDNRINSLAAFHAGYAFFSSVNYHKELEGFAVYALWNGELNGKLESPLPNGGFMLHCDREQALEFLRYGDAFPVFLRLRSKLGRLYAEHLLVSDRDKLFDFYYNGCEVIPPESTCFRNFPSPEDPHYNEEAYAEAPADSVSVSSYGRGSYRSGYHRPGSYRKWGSSSGGYVRGSYLFAGKGRGSYIGGSYYGGSFRFGSLFAGKTFGERGSYRSFANGSYRFWGVALLATSYGGSFRLGSLYGGTGSYQRGSFSLSSFRLAAFGGSYFFGSFFSGSFSGTSFRKRFYNGSFYGGSYHRGSYVYGGCADHMSISEEDSYTEEIMLPGENSLLVVKGNIPVRRLIEEMGYGLDLI